MTDLPGWLARPALLRFAFVLLAAATPILSYPTYRAVVVVVCISALLVAFSSTPEANRRAIRTCLFGSPPTLIAFLAWVALSAFWSSDITSGLLSAVKLAGVGVAGAILWAGASALDETWRRRVLAIFLISTGIVISLLAADVLTGGVLSWALRRFKYNPDYGFFWYDAVSTMTILSTIIAVYLLWRRGNRIVPAAIWLGGSTLAFAIGAKTLGAGMILAVVGATLLVLFRRAAPVVVATVAGLAVTGLVLTAGNLFQPVDVSNAVVGKPAADSIVYRAYIWDFTSQQIRAKPLIGHGVGASRVLGNEDSIQDPNFGALGEPLPLHPHNALLHVWLETGATGLLLVLATIAALLRQLHTRLRANPAALYCAYVLTVSALALWDFSFSAWSTWWICQLVLISVMLRLAIATHPTTDRSAA